MRAFGSILGSTDEQAMWRVQMHDDSDAFASLIRRWEAPIQRLCTRMLGDAHRAEDLTQEAFAKIYAKRKHYQHGARFSTFLWRVATNLCLDEIRRIKRRREFSLFAPEADGTSRDSLDSVASPDHSPDAKFVVEENVALVRKVVQQLPEHYRTVVILRHYENLKFREIAEVLGIPVGTVKSRMAEALTLLNQGLNKSLKEPGNGCIEASGSQTNELMIL